MMLKLESRLSLNLSAQTLEQVLSRRRKMLTDMALGIRLELREQLAKNNEGHLIPTALGLLAKALEYGAYDHPPSWFNGAQHSDSNSAAEHALTRLCSRPAWSRAALLTSRGRACRSSRRRQLYGRDAGDALPPTAAARGGQVLPQTP
jgi:hypothetical protein